MKWFRKLFKRGGTRNENSNKIASEEVLQVIVKTKTKVQK